MTTSPVVGPDRKGGRVVDVNVDHKFGARLLRHAAARIAATALTVGRTAISSSIVSWSRQLILPNRALPSAHAQSRPALTMPSETFSEGAAKGTTSRETRVLKVPAATRRKVPKSPGPRSRGISRTEAISLIDGADTVSVNGFRPGGALFRSPLDVLFFVLIDERRKRSPCLIAPYFPTLILASRKDTKQ